MGNERKPVVLDVWSRKIVGLAMSSRPTTQIVLEALSMLSTGVARSPL